jgi:membrane fusion protein (multidrug efflux system)
MTTQPDAAPPAAPADAAPADAATAGAAPRAGAAPQAGAAAAESGAPAKPSLLHRPAVLIAGGVAALLLLVAGLLWWLHERRYESTDDAFIDTQIVRLAPQIAGQVIAVMVDDNQSVKTGQPLVLIDSADAQSRVAQATAQRAQAQAQLDDARAQIQIAEATLRQSRADTAAAEAQATIAALDRARYRRLAELNPAAVSQQQLDQADTTARQTHAMHDAAVRAAQVRAVQVAASRTLVAAAEQQLAAAQAQLDQAGISFGYARILAPMDGHVAQKGIAVGDYVQPGTQILAIVPLQLWVTANFKETQLVRMRAGQPVTIVADACPDANIRGHVDSIQRGAGQAFAILPPENATGNFVKVVQRVPVKILMDDVPRDCLIGPGMSVEPQVLVR